MRETAESTKLRIVYNKQYYVVWNNKNTLYIDKKLSVQLDFVLITTGVILFCYLLFY